MLADLRHNAILRLLHAHGAVTQAELVATFNVSGVTVRRDLIALDRRGLLRRVHGGAVPANRTSATRARRTADLESTERAIAAAAAARIRPGDVIALSAGSTTVALARALVGVGDLIVLTNSLPVANALRDPTVERTLLLVGGVATHGGTQVGSFAVAAIRSVHVDTLFLNVYGMHATTGFTGVSVMEAEADRALVRAARRVVVLADHSKWATVGISTIAALSDVDTLISDAGLGTEARGALRPHIGELVLVDQPRPHT